MAGPLVGFAAKRAIEFLGGHLMGLGYTSGAYTGYGISNTVDPLGIHQKSYRPPQKIQFRMPYGRRYYGRRSYYSRYGRRYRRRRSYRRYRRFY